MLRNLVVNLVKKPVTQIIGTDDFLPSQILNLGLWLDALLFSSFTFNGADVEIWADRSVNNRDASEPNPIVQATYEATGLNGLPTLSFDGSNRLKVNWIPSRGDYTGFVVFKTADGTRNVFLSQDDTGTTNSVDSLFGLGTLSVFVSPDGTLTLETHGTAGAINGVNTTQTFDDGIAHVSGFKVEGTSFNVFADSFSASSISTMPGFFGADSIDPLVIGARVNAIPVYVGRISEVIIYERALITAEIDLVKNYLKNKWGTP